jgi:hypothetical protein
MAKKQQRPDVGPVGRFIPCPANSDTHPERLALEVKRTYDKKDKMRFSAHCPLCNTRIFLNNWKPGPRSRTLVQAEAEKLHPIGVSEEHRAELLRDLGLVMVPNPPVPPGAPQGALWPVAPPVYAPRRPPTRPRKA